MRQTPLPVEKYTTIFHVNGYEQEKQHTPSALSMRLTELKNSATEFFAEAKSSISNTAHKFGDWVKSVFICTDSRSSEAGKPVDSDESMSLDKKVIDNAHEGLMKHIPLVKSSIEDKNYISKEIMQVISQGDACRERGEPLKSAIRDITTKMHGVTQLQEHKEVSALATEILQTKIEFDGIDVIFRSLGSVDKGQPIWAFIDNETFTGKFKEQVAEVFKRIENELIPQLLVSLASGSPGDIGFAEPQSELVSLASGSPGDIGFAEPQSE